MGHPHRNCDSQCTWQLDLPTQTHSTVQTVACEVAADSSLEPDNVLAKVSGTKLYPVKDAACFQPHLATLFIHERFDGGLGYGETHFGLHDQLLGKAAQLIRRCGCVTGCPACVGPAAQPVDYATESTNRKSLARALVDTLC